MDQVVVSAKIPKSLKEEIDRLGIKVSKVIRNALFEAVRKRKLELIKKKRKKLMTVLKKIPDDRVVKTIRESREMR